MARFRSIFRDKLGIVVLLLAFVSAFAQEDCALAQEKRQSENKSLMANEISEELFQFNFDHWVEWVTQELNKDEIVDRAGREVENLSGETLQTDLKKESSSLLEKLSLEFLKSDNPTEAQTEAALQVAIQKARKRDSALLQVLIGKPFLRPSARTRALLVYARLTRLQLPSGNVGLRAFDKEREFENVIREIETLPVQQARPLKFFALIGAGDDLYSNFLFGRAETTYALALLEFKRLPLSQTRAVEELEGSLLVRLVWSSFKAGRIQSTLEYGRQYAERRAFLLRPVTQAVESEMIRAVSIALFERDRLESFEIFSDNVASAEFGKTLALRGLQQFQTLGRPDRGLVLSKSLQKSFRNSLSEPSYWQERASLSRASRAQEQETFQSMLSLVNVCQRDSELRLRFSSNSDFQEACRNLVFLHSEKTSQYFGSLYQKTSEKVHAINAYSALGARLTERYQKEQRGSILVQAAELALKAGFLNEALGRGQEAFGFPLSNGETLRNHSALTTASRLLAEGNVLPLQTHLNFLDAMVSEFPSEQVSRALLFESGLFLLRREKIQEGTDRVKRSVSLTPKDSAGEISFLEGGVATLVKAYLSQNQTERSVLDLSSIESELYRKGVSLQSQQTLHYALSSLVRRHSLELRRTGKLDESGKYISRFASTFPRNPESPALLRDGIASLVELGNSAEARMRIQDFERLFSSSKWMSEILLFKAQLLENQLVFRPALLAYQSACDPQKTALSRRVCLGVLKKASDLAWELRETGLFLSFSSLVAGLYLELGEVRNAFRTDMKRLQLLRSVRSFELARETVVETQSRSKSISLAQKQALNLMIFDLEFESGIRLSEEKHEVQASNIRKFLALSDAQRSAVGVLPSEDDPELLARFVQAESRLLDAIWDESPQRFQAGLVRSLGRIRGSVRISSPEFSLVKGKLELKSAERLASLETTSETLRSTRAVSAVSFVALFESARGSLLAARDNSTSDSPTRFEASLLLARWLKGAPNAVVPLEPILGKGLLARRKQGVANGQ